MTTFAASNQSFYYMRTYVNKSLSSDALLKVFFVFVCVCGDECLLFFDLHTVNCAHVELIFYKRYFGVVFAVCYYCCARCWRRYTKLINKYRKTHKSLQCFFHAHNWKGVCVRPHVS